MQGVRRNGSWVYRCPWVTPSRYVSGLISGVEAVSCDNPLEGDRDPNGIEPYGD
jgi:hypothetical protein